MIKITDSQWSIMEVLWDSPKSMTVNEIRAILDQERGIRWNKNTVNTFLSRLAENKAVYFYETSPKTWYAVLSREECVRAEGRDFLNKVYHGSIKMMIASFLKEESLSEEELAELRALLKEDDHG